jgi:hypothetical protein
MRFVFGRNGGFGVPSGVRNDFRVEIFEEKSMVVKKHPVTGRFLIVAFHEDLCEVALVNVYGLSVWVLG